MPERKLASIRTITAIEPIPGADRIEVATVAGGWRVIVKRGEYQVGDRAVYFEIDSFLPEGNPQWQFLLDRSSREFNGQRGHVLRTVKLRGVYSQGLLLPLEPTCQNIESELFDGLDVSYPLGIVKYEPPIPAALAGLTKGLFPSWIRKTDQTRVQNLADRFADYTDKMFQVQEKLEGSSVTFYLRSGEFGVCSRNLELQRTDDNTFWKVAIENDIEGKLRQHSYGWDIAIQGELVGPGIQGNIYKLSKHEVRFFDVFNIAAGAYLIPSEALRLIEKMGLTFVPVLGEYVFTENTTVDKLLEMADGNSALFPTQREGLVFKFVGDGGLTFKVISNSYLEKQK
jgi:RNA ligase (TIGR02306 family)